jgi:hypothetical protein
VRRFDLCPCGAGRRVGQYVDRQQLRRRPGQRRLRNETGTLRFAVAHAIDTGNYVFGGPDSFDQRGSAAVSGSNNYERVSGLTLKADIAAHEVQQDDVVFDADFEGCPSP